MDADIFDGRIHLFQNALERTRFSRPAEWIPMASDIEARLEMSEPVTRQSMGLESATTVSGTFGDLDKLAGTGYLRVLSEVLKRFPKHFHIFAGAGNVRGMRAYLHSESVLPRVRFLGQIGEVAPLLGMIDVYLASFPHAGGHSILEAMGAGKPVVVLKFPPDSPYNSGAELVGMRELIAPGEADYIEIADRLLRTPALRARQGQSVLDRFRAEFRPVRLGERYKAFIEKLDGNNSGTDV
jgi:predicted O-linked N-acetylglucosamine transferase (SPINDLY family)